jgi:protocatechuate 3,4-dioxygenase beta subunit
MKTRRIFLGSVGSVLSTAMFTTRGLFAERLAATPRLTEGPYYPDHLPLDRDNDLVIVDNRITPAVGAITHLSGRVLDSSGDPVKDATIEIWQVDNNGVYLNTRDRKHAMRDTNFQGYGTFTTASAGDYRFRTIKPVPYDDRCPHIHVRVNRGGREVLTTQIFVAGHELNKQDMVLGGLRDPYDRELVTTEFKPIAKSDIGELAARFDIVLGDR